ncbi:radical SAM/SPASM domain-containing protein [Desulfobacter vibrioformis]|uniref:radical SAM/SPASM domain-containing protein n=1 Tax=Desulfobacter vibrioformis TaxID=34031 RepID=UPI00146FD973|nr:radical SAM protein [Desulfobacter vibrioformis]
MKRICIERIPQNSRVAIYGAGESGRKIKIIIEYLRPDIKILFFIDSFKSFIFEGFQCLKLSEAISQLHEVELILIASAFYRDISNILDIFEIHNYYIIDRCYYRLNFTQSEELKTMERQLEQCKKRSLIPRMNFQDSYIRSIENDLNELKNMQDAGFWPLSIMVQISKKCNLRCLFCGHEGWKENTGFMEFNLFKRIIREIEEYGAPITLVGPQGEPSLHPKFSEFMTYVGMHAVDTLLCTNGTALTQTKIESIVNSGIKEVQISFAGYDKKSYESIYVGAKFESVVRNIKMLSDEIRRSKADIKLVIKGIFPEYARTNETFENFKSKCLSFYDSLNLVGVQSVSNKPHNFAGTIHLGKYFKEIGVHSVKNISNIHPKLCPQLFNPCIHYDGKVSTCGCHDYNCTMQIGDLAQESLLEIMQGNTLQKMIVNYMERRYESLPLCKKCDFPYIDG